MSVCTVVITPPRQILSDAADARLANLHVVFVSDDDALARGNCNRLSHRIKFAGNAR